MPAPRPFYLGMTPFPPSFDEKGVDAAYAALAKHTDLVSHHLDDGVPWPEALARAPFPKHVEDDLKLRLDRTPKNAKIFLSCTPLALTRDQLAGRWNTASNQPRDGAWKDRSWKDPEVLQAYLNYCRELIARFKPAYMAYGIEVNLYAENAEFKDFKAFLAQVYATLKREFPRLPLCLTFVLHDPGNAKKEPLRKAIGALLPLSDLAAVSAHGFMELPDPVHPPAAWFDQILSIKGMKPFAIAETSMIAETLELKAPPLKLPGTPERQAEFMRWLLRRCAEVKAEFVVWFLPLDYDEAWKTLEGMNGPEWFKIWKDTGLYEAPGMPRPACAVWDAWLKLPRK